MRAARIAFVGDVFVFEASSSACISNESTSISLITLGRVLPVLGESMLPVGLSVRIPSLKRNKKNCRNADSLRACELEAVPERDKDVSHVLTLSSSVWRSV